MLRPISFVLMGRVYLVGILLGSSAGLYMAFYAYAGMAASLGFAAYEITAWVCWLPNLVIAEGIIRGW